MVLDTLTETFSRLTATTFTLQDLEGFPYEQYEKQRARYEEAERWYLGLPLDEQIEQAGEKVDLYPLKINPLIGTVAKHAYTLFGEVEDDGRPLVLPKLIPVDDNQKDLADYAEEQLNHVWWENNGRSLMIENGILSQIYGGCVFKATYVPWESTQYGGWRNVPIRIELINPKFFLGTPDASDDYRLAEAWIIKPIGEIEAKKWGYTPEYDEDVFWIERITPETMRTQINDMVVRKQVGDTEHVLDGENPFGFVPAIYIPHIRQGSFYGVNAFDHLKGLVKEMNLRFGDYGDAVSDDAHSWIAMRNVSGSPQVKSVAKGLPVIDLQGTAGITGNEPEPDMFEIRKQRASTTMKDLVVEIYQQYRRDASIPAVADGEDEGSQRSGMTLAMRFWPLGSHVSTERYFWTSGMDVFQPMLLKMMAVKGIGKMTLEHTAMRIKQKWAPLLPRDREALVQEWVQRASANLGSIEHLLELTGDVEDVDEEKEKILAFIKEIKKIEAEFAPQPQEGQFGNSSSGTTSVAKGGSAND
jgi:hypothetical protein